MVFQAFLRGRPRARALHASGLAVSGGAHAALLVLVALFPALTPLRERAVAPEARAPEPIWRSVRIAGLTYLQQPKPQEHPHPGTLRSTETPRPQKSRRRTAAGRTGRLASAVAVPRLAPSALRPLSDLSTASPAVVPPPIQWPPPGTQAKPAPNRNGAGPGGKSDQGGVFEAPASLARGLRIYERFPSLPGALSRPGMSYPISLRICVAADGAVSNVRLVKGADKTLDAEVLAAVQTWRYRPLRISGVTRPFCHDLRITYRCDGRRW